MCNRYHTYTGSFSLVGELAPSFSVSTWHVAATAHLCSMWATNGGADRRSTTRIRRTRACLSSTWRAMLLHLAHSAHGLSYPAAPPHYCCASLLPLSLTLSGARAPPLTHAAHAARAGRWEKVSVPLIYSYHYLDYHRYSPFITMDISRVSLHAHYSSKTPDVRCSHTVGRTRTRRAAWRDTPRAHFPTGDLNTHRRRNPRRPRPLPTLAPLPCAVTPTAQPHWYALPYALTLPFTAYYTHYAHPTARAANHSRTFFLRQTQRDHSPADPLPVHLSFKYLSLYLPGIIWNISRRVHRLLATTRL